MTTTRVLRHVSAPRARVYQALVDGASTQAWMVPAGMSSEVHHFDAREGGTFRISLTYDEPTGTGKTSAHTDTHHGRFLALVPDERVVREVQFETDDPALQGVMTITMTLRDVDGGTEVLGVHEGLPRGVSPADNELGWSSSLAQLAALVEGDGVTIRDATSADAPGVAAIYDHYVANTVVTFEEEPVPVAEMARRMEEVRSVGLPWLVVEEGGRVVGYAYAQRWRGRAAYRFSVEVTVYLAPGAGGRGLGRRVYRQLFCLLRARGTHVVIGGIALPNDASVALHEALGMQKVAHFAEVGFKHGRWVDCGFWQLTFPAGRASSGDR